MNFKIYIFVIAALIYQIAALEINVKEGSVRNVRDTKSVKKSGDGQNVDKRGWWWWGSPYLIREDEPRTKRDVKKSEGKENSDKRGWWWWGSPYLIREDEPRTKRDVKKSEGKENGDKRGWWWWGSPYLIREDEPRTKREALDIPLVKLPKLGANFRSARNVKPNSKHDVPDKFKKSGGPRSSGSKNAPSKRGWCWWCWWWW